MSSKEDKNKKNKELKPQPEDSENESEDRSSDMSGDDSEEEEADALHERIQPEASRSSAQDESDEQNETVTNDNQSDSHTNQDNQHNQSEQRESDSDSQSQDHSQSNQPSQSQAMRKQSASQNSSAQSESEDEDDEESSENNESQEESSSQIQQSRSSSVRQSDTSMNQKQNNSKEEGKQNTHQSINQNDNILGTSQDPHQQQTSQNNLMNISQQKSDQGLQNKIINQEDNNNINNSRSISQARDSSNDDSEESENEDSNSQDEHSQEEGQNTDSAHSSQENSHSSDESEHDSEENESEQQNSQAQTPKSVQNSQKQVAISVSEPSINASKINSQRSDNKSQASNSNSNRDSQNDEDSDSQEDEEAQQIVSRNRRASQQPKRQTSSERDQSNQSKQITHSQEDPSNNESQQEAEDFTESDNQAGQNSNHSKNTSNSESEDDNENQSQEEDSQSENSSKKNKSKMSQSIQQISGNDEDEGESSSDKSDKNDQQEIDDQNRNNLVLLSSSNAEHIKKLSGLNSQMNTIDLDHQIKNVQVYSRSTSKQNSNSSEEDEDEEDKNSDDDQESSDEDRQSKQVPVANKSPVKPGYNLSQFSRTQNDDEDEESDAHSHSQSQPSKNRIQEFQNDESDQSSSQNSQDQEEDSKAQLSEQKSQKPIQGQKMMQVISMKNTDDDELEGGVQKFVKKQHKDQTHSLQGLEASDEQQDGQNTEDRETEGQDDEDSDEESGSNEDSEDESNIYNDAEDENTENQDYKINEQLKKDVSGVVLQENQFKVNQSEYDIFKAEQPQSYEDFQKEEENLLNIYFGYQQRKSIRSIQSNKVRTQKYSAYTWAFQSLFIQFKRVSNIYFLIISILTFLPFSPKQPASMVGTFAFVLLFTMLKEAYEDYQRYKQDKEINNKTCLVLNQDDLVFEKKKWEEVHPGYIVKIQKDEQMPADVLLLYSSDEAKVVFVDTLNLDGETNLKDKLGLLTNFENKKLAFLNGMVKTENPDENLEKWEGLIMFESQTSPPLQCDIKNLALRGSSLRNTQYAIGLVVYTGMDTKILKNHKKPRQKISNIMSLMNNMLYTVFALQIIIVIVMAGLNTRWTANNANEHSYLGVDVSNKAELFFLQLLVFWVAYSHMIPISLYVIIELLKLGIAMFFNNDVQMYDQVSGNMALCRNSDLVEELGQIEMIFSDKTGTLTQNRMIFRKCSINGTRYGEYLKGEEEVDDGMCLSGVNQTIKLVKKELDIDEDELDSEDEAQYPYVSQFFLGLALCNTVTVEKVYSAIDKQKEISYKATSPDDLALVIGAKASGMQLVQRRLDKIIVYNKITKKKEFYKVKAEFMFTQERKRHSIIVKTLDGNYILYSKGADQVMMDRIHYDKNQVEGIQVLINEDLNYYSSQGLRTLLIANRYIMKEEYKQFKKIFQNIKHAKPDQRQEKLEMLYDVMEQKLKYLGISALEDKLQDGVPLTIERLLQTDIRFFMLTGDKLETAKEIGRLCKLVQPGMREIILANMHRDGVERTITKFLIEMRVDISLPIITLEEAPQFNQVIVVEGNILTMIFSDQRLNDLFFHLCIRSKSVICCRMSPIQKADIVNMFRSRGKWITLAIGDGANDVSMLNEAHIGVGITGQEGNQAARAADFQIPKFEYLMRIILYHGRMSYLRVSKMICYYFYKNIILVFTEIYFPFYNGFSGQIFFLDWLPMMYNAIFTSWYCLFSQLLERDINEHYAYKYPFVYKAGQLGRYFNYQIFWRWIILAAIHGGLCFYIPIINGNQPLSSQPKGSMTEHWVRSTQSFSVIVHIVFYKLLIETRHFNWISMFLGIFSLFLYYFFLGIGQIPFVAEETQYEALGVYVNLLVNPNFWIQVIILPFGILIPDFTLYFLQQVFFATPVDTVLSKQKFDPDFDFRIFIKTKEYKENIAARESLLQNQERRKTEMETRRKTYFSNKSPFTLGKQGTHNYVSQISQGGKYSDISRIGEMISKEKNTQELLESEDERSSRENSHTTSQQDDTLSGKSQSHNFSGTVSDIRTNRVPKNTDGKSSHEKKSKKSKLNKHDSSKSQSDEENKHSQSSQGNRIKKKKRRDLEESNRSMNMSIRSNQELVDEESSIKRAKRSKADLKLKKQKTAQVSVSSLSSQEKRDSNFTISSISHAIEMRGNLASHRKKHLEEKKLKNQRQNSHEDEEDEDDDEEHSNKRYKDQRNIDVESMNNSMNQSMEFNNYDRVSLIDSRKASVELKTKLPLADLTRKIFSSMFGTNKSRMKQITRSAFDKSSKFKFDETKDPESQVADQIVNALISGRIKEPQQAVVAHPEFVKVIGHPLLQSSPRKKLPPLPTVYYDLGKAETYQRKAAAGSDQGVSNKGSALVSSPKSQPITPGIKKEKKYLQKYRNIMANQLSTTGTKANNYMPRQRQ